jgi:vitamin B12 transporter
MYGNLLSDNLKGLNLGLGLRLNNHSSFGGSTTYEINPSYQLNENSIIYGSWSTGFNAPALYRIYSPNENFTSKVTRGNPELNPASSSSFEFGVKQKVNKKTSFTLSVFQTKVSNLIEYVYLWDKAVGIDTLGNDWMRSDDRGDTYINAGDQTNQGFELSIKTELSKKLFLNANVSVVSGKLNYDPSQSTYTDDYHVQLFATGDFLTEEIESFGLVRRSNTANLNLRYKANKKLSLATNVRYAGVRNDIFYDSSLGPWGALGQQQVGDYTLVDFTANYQILDELQATLSVNNAFNTDYQEIYGFSTRGRGFYLKLNYALNK